MAIVVAAHRITIILTADQDTPKQDQLRAITEARKEAWEFLDGVEGDTVEFRYRPPFPNALAVEFIRGEPDYIREIIALFDEDEGASARAGLIGLVEIVE
jgi:hypothetical protein